MQISFELKCLINLVIFACHIFWMCIGFLIFLVLVLLIEFDYMVVYTSTVVILFVGLQGSC